MMADENLENSNQLRSMESTIRSPVKFDNKTAQTVEIFWLDFSGNPVSYGTLQGQSSLAINSFVTHPWIAVECESKKRFWLNSKEVYYPPVPQTVRVVVGHNREQMRVRRAIGLVTHPVYNPKRLMQICCQIVSNIMNSDDIDLLPLPRVIKKEIRRHYNQPA